MSYFRVSAQAQLGITVCIGLFGLLMSVVLHELFHVIVHWGHITAIHLLPGPYTLVAIESIGPAGYDTTYEEAAAYTVTLLTMLVTMMCISMINDARDKRTSAQLLFPRNRDMQQLEPSAYFELAHRADVI